jgi:biopolymer transport protein ExbB/TolQ
MMIKKRNDKIFNDRIKNITAQDREMLLSLLSSQFSQSARLSQSASSTPSTSSTSSTSSTPLTKDNSLFTKYLRAMLNGKNDEAYTDYLISNFENEANKDLSLSKMLAKMGPVLGLIGTLIAMSPALVGLSTGDISGMAYNMQVVFATTVVGLVISAIGLVTLQFKQRWYAKDIYSLEYISRVLIKENEK